MFRMDSGYGGSHDSTIKKTNERGFPDLPQNNGKNDKCVPERWRHEEWEERVF